jgi:hypothetical protein
VLCMNACVCLNERAHANLLSGKGAAEGIDVSD